MAEIEKLKSCVNGLECQIGDIYFAEDARVSRLEKRFRDTENERVERERQAESDRWYREDELKKATKDLERAVSYNDPWAISRAREKLKKVVSY